MTFRKGIRQFKHVGKHLEAARSRAGLSQQDLARRTGIDPATINRIERSKRLPTLEQMVRLAEVLQVSWQWFWTGSNRPGEELEDLAVELQNLGIVDLIVPGARLPGAFRRPEEVVTLVLSNRQPEPRIVEAVPAVLAWNRWNASLLRAHAAAHDRRTLHRVAWLADIALTIDRLHSFPGGVVDREQLQRFLDLAGPRRTETVKRSRNPDGLGHPGEGPFHPVWRRWRITYAANLATFRNRAEHLKALRGERRCGWTS